MLYPFLCGCKTNHPKRSCLKQKQLSFWRWSLDGTALGICKVTWYDGDFSRCLSLSWALFLCVSFSITLPVNLHYLWADCPIVIDNGLGHKLPLSLGQLHLSPSTEQFLRLIFGVCSDGGGVSLLGGFWAFCSGYLHRWGNSQSFWCGAGGSESVFCFSGRYIPALWERCCVGTLAFGLPDLPLPVWNLCPTSELHKTNCGPIFLSRLCPKWSLCSINE